MSETRRLYTSADYEGRLHVDEDGPCPCVNCAMLTQAAAQSRVLVKLRKTLLESPPDNLYSWNVWVGIMDRLLSEERLLPKP